MAIRSETTEINGTRYVVTTLQAYEALEAALDLAKLVAPAFTDESAESVKISKLFDQDNDAMVASMARIVAAADKVVVRRVLDALARNTQIQTPEGTSAILEQVFNIHFAGSPEDMLRWAAFALRVNYGNFFGASTSDEIVKFEAELQKRETARRPSA